MKMPKLFPSLSAHPRCALSICCLAVALTHATPHATAQDLPVKPPQGKYAGLWNNSPFTSRPVVVAPEPLPEVNPLEDYALVGVSPVTDGFRVTLINRNDPTERITVDSSRPDRNPDFKVVGVNRSPGRPLATTVTLASGSVTGTVAFEQDLLTLRPPPAAPAQQQQRIRQPQAEAQQVQAGQQGSAVRMPRPRVVPPPNASGNPQQGRPQLGPGRQQGINRQSTGGSSSRGERGSDRRIRR